MQANLRWRSAGRVALVVVALGSGLVIALVDS
ncbi:MAG: hypothetical protein QOJ75_1939, partial [Chloroflexota bacterium]|nr:hypothetical protein [Chloroflexota bacterium]